MLLVGAGGGACARTEDRLNHSRSLFQPDLVNYVTSKFFVCGSVQGLSSGRSKPSKKGAGDGRGGVDEMKIKAYLNCASSQTKGQASRRGGGAKNETRGKTFMINKTTLLNLFFLKYLSIKRCKSLT